MGFKASVDNIFFDSRQIISYLNPNVGGITKENFSDKAREQQSDPAEHVGRGGGVSGVPQRPRQQEEQAGARSQSPQPPLTTRLRHDLPRDAGAAHDARGVPPNPAGQTCERCLMRPRPFIFRENLTLLSIALLAQILSTMRDCSRGFC